MKLIDKISGIEFFCKQNANSIVGCDWYKTKHCQKTCKFYKKQKKIDLEKAKYWTR